MRQNDMPGSPVLEFRILNRLRPGDYPSSRSRERRSGSNPRTKDTSASREWDEVAVRLDPPLWLSREVHVLCATNIAMLREEYRGTVTFHLFDDLRSIDGVHPLSLELYRDQIKFFVLRARRELAEKEMARILGEYRILRDMRLVPRHRKSRHEQRMSRRERWRTAQ